MHNAVKCFLKRFQHNENIHEPLSAECSYWFAAVLFGRFIRDGAEIVYDESAEHFGTMIKGRVYDVTGDVTSEYKWSSWRSIKEDDHKKDIIRKYIMF